MKPAFFPVIMGGRRGSVTQVFSPASLFTSGAKGAWYDPSDYNTLFQDSAGTTPVTAVEQPVGLMLDKSQGLAGTQQINDPSFDSGITGWGTQFPGADVTFAWNSTLKSMTVTRTGAGLTGRPTYPISVVSGTWYKITIITNAAGVTNALAFSVTDAANGTIISGFNPQSVSTQTTVKYGVATSTGTAYVGLWCNTSASVDILSIEVTAVAGNHASQATPTSCPVLRARYNLLTYSEQFDNAGWVKTTVVTVTANAVVAPDGTSTADKLVETATTAIHTIYQTATLAAVPYTYSVYLKKAERSWAYVRLATATGQGAYFNLDTGTIGTVETGITASIQDVGSGWYRCCVSITATATAWYAQHGPTTGDNISSYLGNGTSGIYAWGADLRTGSSAGTYQRIAAATDYDTAGFLPYLYFVTDDSFGTGSIDFTATDKMFVCAGVTKLSDAAVGIIAELSLSAGSGAYPGTFVLHNQTSPVGYRFAAGSGASGAAFATDDFSTFTAPITNVVSGIANLAGTTINDEISARVNGVVPTQSISGAISTGNFGNWPLYIGRRGNASLPFEGRIYGLIVAGKTLSASELASTESWMNSKTGAY